MDLKTASVMTSENDPPALDALGTLPNAIDVHYRLFVT